MLTTLLLVLAATPAAPAVHGSPEPLVVSTQWLADHLGDRNLVLFHIGSDRTEATYRAGHIARAQFVNPFTDFTAPRAEGALTLEMPSLAQLTEALRARGVTAESRIVLYWSDGYATPTTRLYLTLAYAGLGDRVSILDGGLEAWKAEGRPVTEEVAAIAPSGFTPTLRPDLVVDAPFVYRSLAAPDVKVIDARAAEFYNGRETGQGRNGHIPGAASVPFLSILTEDGRFKDAATLRAAFLAAGAKPGDKVVTYCHIGQQATLVWFGARLAGFDAALYDGSFQDWAARTDLPVEPGTPPAREE